MEELSKRGNFWKGVVAVSMAFAGVAAFVVSMVASVFVMARRGE